MESLSTFVQSPLFSRLTIILIGVIVIALFWWRAGSIHSLLDRLWRLVAGKADVADPVLKALLQESRDIEKFNYTYRLKVETMAAIHKLDKWRRTHELGMSKLQTIRPWINVNSTELLRRPPNYYAPLHLLLAFLAFLLMLGVSQLAASRDAYFQMRASKVWFKTDAVTVKAPFDGWSFNAAKCVADKTAIAQLTGFNTSETDAVCTALKDDGLKQLVKHAVVFQRWAGIVSVIVAFAVAVNKFLAATSAVEALRLYTRLSPRVVGDGKAKGEMVPTKSPKTRSVRPRRRSKSKPDDASAHPSEPHDP